MNAEWQWSVVAFAARQPRGNAHWEAILDELFTDIARYLAFVEESRRDA